MNGSFPAEDPMARSISGTLGRSPQAALTKTLRDRVASRTEKELAGMDDAHEGMIWDMSWHPLGHMLVSGSNDHTTSVLTVSLNCGSIL